MTRRIVLALAGWLALSGLADAEEKKQVVRFDGDTIDGDIVRPEGDLMAVRPSLEFPNLVRPPSHFEDAAARDLQAAAEQAARLLGGRDGD